MCINLSYDENHDKHFNISISNQFCVSVSIKLISSEDQIKSLIVSESITQARTK